MKKWKKTFQWKNGKNLPWPRLLLNHPGTLHCSRNVLNWINRDFVSVMFHVPLLLPKWLASTSSFKFAKHSSLPVSHSVLQAALWRGYHHAYFSHEKTKVHRDMYKLPHNPTAREEQSQLGCEAFQISPQILSYFSLPKLEASSSLECFWCSSSPLHKSFGEDEAFCEKPEKNQGFLPKAMWVSHLAIQSSSLN